MLTELKFDFATEMSAHMSGLDAGQYVETMNTCIDQLDSWEKHVNALKINSNDDFQKATQLKSILSSLSCYTFNSNLSQNDQVWALEHKLGKKILKWAKAQSAPSEYNMMIRYILWNKFYLDDDKLRKQILDALIDKGYIVKHQFKYGNEVETKFVVTGIKCKVGDNVFTADKNGRYHRQYGNVCNLQCFELKFLDEAYVSTKDVQENNDDMYFTSFGDGKGCARHPKFSYKEYLMLKKMFLNSSL